MNAIDYLTQLASEKQKTQVPAMLDPIRNAGNAMGDAIAASRTTTPMDQWGTISPQEKLIRAGKFLGSIAGEGASRTIPQVVAGGLSVSPPGQLAAYSMGQPNPKDQITHALQGLSPALFTGMSMKAAAPFWVSDLQKML